MKTSIKVRLISKISNYTKENHKKRESGLSFHLAKDRLPSGLLWYIV
jgi:hypothetical protein